MSDPQALYNTEVNFYNHTNYYIYYYSYGVLELTRSKLTMNLKSVVQCGAFR